MHINMMVCPCVVTTDVKHLGIIAYHFVDGVIKLKVSLRQKRLKLFTVFNILYTSI